MIRKVVSIIYCIIISFILSMSVEAQIVIDLDTVKNAGLRVVHITTHNGEEPQGIIISNPWEEDNNLNIKDSNKVECRIVLTQENDTLYDSGDYEKNISGATIRINGNTSAYYSDSLNMPYKLKLEHKADLLCRANDSIYADKNWRLLKDAVSLNTIIGLYVSELINMEWTSAFIPCNVIINGDYRGCYLLMETVRRNNKCRINTDKQTGYIVERDPYWWKEQKYFSTSWYENKYNYRWTWKYPDEDDVTTEQELYIQQYINDTEKAIREGNYNDYIDLESFTKWILVHDILGTRDSGGSNMYFKKYDNTDNSKLEMPCIWDFDSNFEVPINSFSRLHTSDNAYFNTLFQSSNQSFNDTYIKLWNDNKKYLKQYIVSFINNYIASDEAKALDRSIVLYNKRWGYTYPNLHTHASYVLSWFNSRFESLDPEIQSLSHTDIDVIRVANERYQYYNLKGIRQHYNRGINIMRDYTTGKTYKVKN